MQIDGQLPFLRHLISDLWRMGWRRWSIVGKVVGLVTDLAQVLADSRGEQSPDLAQTCTPYPYREVSW